MPGFADMLSARDTPSLPDDHKQSAGDYDVMDEYRNDVTASHRDVSDTSSDQPSSSDKGKIFKKYEF